MESVTDLTKFISQLDDSQIHNFLAQMPLDIICKFEAADQRLANFCQKEQLWQAKVRRDYPNAVSNKPAELSWREYYMQLHSSK